MSQKNSPRQRADKEESIKLSNVPPKGIAKHKMSKNSLEIMKKRHLLKDEDGNLIETPKQMFWRVASAMGLEDAKYIKGAKSRKERVVTRTAEEFFETLSNNKFFPGSRVLFEAGNNIDGTGQLSSCFVLPIEDDLGSIFDTMKEAAMVQKNNGGTGFNFSHIRPKGDSVGGTKNVAAGPLHFIKSFSQAFDQVLQGKKRGGGNMAILNVNHPDIIEFINLKGTNANIRNFNISVGITDVFMDAVRNDEEYDLINPRNDEVVKTLSAKEVFDLICQKAWECADPGMFFLDAAQKANPTPHIGVIEATNPCGEEPLRSYESCNLGSVVLPRHLKKSKGSSKVKLEIDWTLLKKTVHTAIHFLDNMIDLSKFPLQKIADEVHKTRKLGLGVMGTAAMLYSLEIPYNSKKATDLVEKIVKFVQDESVKASILLAEERGVFPAFKGSTWDKKGEKVRNATMTSIAPNGTLSLVADTSSGIEPVFSLVFSRKSFYQDEGQEEHKTLLYVNNEFEEYAKKEGFYSEKLMQKIADNKGLLVGLDEVPEKAKKIFVTTHDITPKWHVAMQAATQKNIDAAVSKTVNLPFDATIEDVFQTYIQAWETGCKGITIYRDGSKQLQVMESVKKEEKKKEEIEQYDEGIKNELTPNALQVLEKRALKKDHSDTVVETPEELWLRIAKHIASAEKGANKAKYQKLFFEIMNNGEFLSGGTLLWAGMGKDSILSKCLVLPIDDSIDSIFTTLNWNIQCLRRGVGTGFNFSKIRSTYARVNTTGEFAAGPIEYLRMFNRAQETIRGKGGRELGSMAILNVEHPNIEDFIESKDDLKAINHYNISIGASDKFMKAVKNDKDWKLVDPSDNKTYKTIRARDLFEKIAKHAWKSGDPGIYFIDQARKGNNTPSLGDMNATNPCGEQPLLPFETCNLGNINLSKMVKGFPYATDVNFKDVSFSKKLEYIDWDRIATVAKVGVRFLDNIIDINNYPIPEIEEMTKKTRNVGVGLMGFADMLVKLGVRYGSAESIKIAKHVMKFINEAAHESSIEIGKEKGNFPAFKESNWFEQGLKNRRNVRTTTIAPTGTISIIANCNPGIEPMFALGYKRKNSMGGADQEVIEHLFESVAKTRDFYSVELMSEIADGKSLHELEERYNIPADVVAVFKTSHDINPEEHVQIQGAFQKYIESAVSKTINMPKTAKWQDIARVYTLAYDLGCKGITVFRDGSKDPALQVGTKDKTEESKAVAQAASAATPATATFEPKPRADMYKGFTYSVNTEQGTLFVTVNEDDQGIFEIFLNLGKSGSYTAGYTQAIGRLVSMSLRSGIRPEHIIDQLQGIRTSAPTMNKGMIVYSVPDAVAKIMRKHMKEAKKQMNLLETKPKVVAPVVEGTPKEVAVEEVPEVAVQQEIVTKQIVIEPAEEPKATPEAGESKYNSINDSGDLLECPECGSDLEYAEGCILCRSCGYSKCG